MTFSVLSEEYMATLKPLTPLVPVGEDPGWFCSGLEMPEGAGALLAAMFGPSAGQPPSGPPHTHVHRPPETDEEIAASPWPPITHTITRDGE